MKNTHASSELTFCVVADWQIPDDNLTHLAERLVAENPEFVVIPGDLVMAKGADPAPWDAFFERIRPLTEARIPIRPIPGNHDFDGGLDAARKQWLERLERYIPNYFYSFDAAPAHFIGLCVTPLSYSVLHEEFDLPEGRMTQLEWFTRDLERSRDASWRFVYHHEPGTAFCRLDAPNDGPGLPEISELVEPLAWREGIDLVFRGHQHFYERTYPVNPVNRVRDDSRGTAFITLGGGCNAYRPVDPNDAVPFWFDAVVAVHQMHYLKIKLTEDKLNAEAKNLGGDVYDRFTIRKHPDGSRDWEGLPPAPIFLVNNQPQSY